MNLSRLRQLASRNRGRVALVSILLLLAVGALYVATAGVPSRIAELLAEGGEKVLREPMRPARATTRVLVFAMDGVGEDELLDAVRGGGAPRIAALLGAPEREEGVFGQAYAVPGVLSILPSTTIAAWSSLFTGEPASRTGVPGNEWLAREEMKFHAPAPVSVTDPEQALALYTDGLLGHAVRVPTLFERADVRSYVSLGQLHRGADLLITPEPGALGDLVGGVVRGVVNGEGAEEEAFRELDRSSVESLLESLRKYGVPDLQVVYFPGVDLYTHVAEQPIASQRRYLQEVVDSAVGDVLRVYEEQGALRDTYVLFVSDHGHTPVIDDDRHALGTGEPGEPPELIERAGFRMRPDVLEPDEDEQDYQAAVAYQGAFAYVYLADRSTCPTAGTRCDWSRAPRMQEDVLPIVRAFHAANRTGAGVPELHGTLDLIFAREPRPPGEDALPFQVWDGERLVPVGEYLSANPRPELLELEARLEGLAAGPYGHRAGDVLLLAKSGPERPIENRYYFSSYYRSWHGSPTGQDSRIPLVVARPGSRGADLRETVRAAVGERPSQLDVTRLILALLRER